MSDVNWWLMALSFLGGLIVTAALTIRRVTREVPVAHSLSASEAGVLDVSGRGRKTPDLGKVAAGAGAALSEAADKVGAAIEAVGDKIEGLFERDTHGSGSARLTPRKVGPAGYTVKFDPDTKLYYLPGSAEYDALETEWWFVDEDSAKAAGFVRWEVPGPAVGFLGAAVAESVDVIPPGPHGKGSALAGADGSGPAGWLIKGKADSMLYHPPDSPYYAQTIAEVWFFDEETAKRAGFAKWDKNIRKS